MKGSLKIWIVILGMVVIGTGITHMTNSYVSYQIEKMAATAEGEQTEDRVFSIEAVPEAARGNLPDEEGVLTQSQADIVSRKSIDSLAAEEAANAAGNEMEFASAETGVPAQNRALEETDGGQETGKADMGQEEAWEDGVKQKEFVQEEDEQEQIRMAMAEDSSSGLVFAEESLGESASGSSTPVLSADGKMSVQEDADAPVNLQEALKEYQERFPQIDQQIDQMRRSETENNVYSVKNTAQTELKIWERELDSLYGLLCASLDEDASQDLVKEQQEWTQLRDGRAEEAAKRNSGGSLESVEYLASVAASNRERAYALLKKYQETVMRP